MPYIPSFNLHRVVVRIRADGRFGNQDYTLAPQVYCDEYEHRVLIRTRQSCADDRMSCMWRTPTKEDFKPIKSSVFADLGRFDAAWLKDLDELTMAVRCRAYDIVHRYPKADLGKMERAVINMRHGIMRLRYNPYTFKDLVLDVAQTQRLYLDALAHCEYIEDSWLPLSANVGPVSRKVHSHRMGAWTTDPSSVQKLHRAGIPVYFVRPTASIDEKCRILHVQTVRQIDHSIVHEDWEAGQIATPFPTRYDGVPSERLHAALSEENRYRDLELYFLDVDAATERLLTPVGPKAQVAYKGSRKFNKDNKPKKLRAGMKLQMTMPTRDKWVELVGNFLPDTVPTWSSAFATVDRTVRLASPPSKSVTGYRFPDPGMIVFSEGRRERNIFNWLAVREATIRKACNEASSNYAIPLGTSNELWRLYIGTDFMDSNSVASTAAQHSGVVVPHSANSTRRQLLLDIFGRPPDTQHVRDMEWYGHKIEWGTFFLHDSLLVREILWDLHQWSFQYDLIAIDRYLAPDMWSRGPSARYRLIEAIFGGNDGLTVPRPDVDFGLASINPAERKTAYSSLFNLMQGWEDNSLASIDDSDELQVACAYCRIFSKTMGRPPILPKIVPKGHNFQGTFPYRRS
ncbi:hypothetical protein HWV62_43547 [Athelia sp. TMB]|nr:hypothetical protein HWV62_43547 [Athelia sp. TMB]